MKSRFILAECSIRVNNIKSCSMAFNVAYHMMPLPVAFKLVVQPYAEEVVYVLLKTFFIFCLLAITSCITVMFSQSINVILVLGKNSQ